MANEQPKKLHWLDEVRADAKFNYLRRLRDQKEQQDFEASKVSGGGLNLRQVAVVEDPGQAQTPDPSQVIENMTDVEKEALAQTGYGEAEVVKEAEEGAPAPKKKAAPQRASRKGGK